MDDAWGDTRITALADLVLSLVAEVFDLRMRVASARTADGCVAPAENQDAAADAFVARVFAPFAALSRADIR